MRPDPDPTPERVDAEALARNVRDHHGPGFESLVLALTAERDAAERRAEEAEREVARAHAKLPLPAYTDTCDCDICERVRAKEQAR